MSTIDLETDIVVLPAPVLSADFARMQTEPVASSGDLTVAWIDVPIRELRNFGLTSVDGQACGAAFEVRLARTTPCPVGSGRVIASMGHHVFNMSLLSGPFVPDAANAASSHDFGQDMRAALVHEHRVFVRRFADGCVNIVEGRSQAGSAGFNSVRVCPRFKLGIDSRPGMRRNGPPLAMAPAAEQSMSMRYSTAAT